MGMNGPLRIPFAEIAAYCTLHGYDYGKRQEFLTYIEKLDTTFMEFIQEKQEEEERKNITKQGAARPGTR